MNTFIMKEEMNGRISGNPGQHIILTQVKVRSSFFLKWVFFLCFLSFKYVFESQ